MRKIVYILIIFVLLASKMSATDFRVLTIDNGLSSNTINCILKDNRGFIWLGTSNGLDRFDGFDVFSCKQFDKKSVVSICEPDSINLYLATENNVYKFNRKNNRVTEIKIATTTQLNIKKLSLDTSKKLYIATDKGLFELKDAQIKPVRCKTNLSINIIDVLIDKSNNCWLTTSVGLVKYDTHNETSAIYDVFGSRTNNLSAMALEDSILFIGNQKEIFKFNPHEKKAKLVATLDNNQILNISCLDNKLYVGTNGGGLKIVDLKNTSITNLVHSTDPKSISSNAVYAFLLDGPTYWIGTFVGGLNYNPKVTSIFDVYKDTFNTNNLNIRSLKVDGDIFVLGTRNGFYYITNDKTHLFTAQNSALKSNIILCVYPFEGDYLIGTYGGGLYLFSQKNLQISVYGENSFFAKNSIYSITTDKSGNLWFGTLNGLIKYNPNKAIYETFSTLNSGLISKDIYAILADSEDRIWIGTNEGLCYYKNGKISTLNNLKLGVRTVRSLFQDNNKNIWVGTEREGVICVNKDLDSFNIINSTGILPDNYVLSIVEDQENWLWICTLKGILHYNPQTKVYRIYSLSDGIPSYMFNPCVQITPDSIIWWGNEKGLVYLNPKQLSKKELKNKIVITQIYIDDKLEEIAKNALPYAPEYLTKISLGSFQNSISIRFSDLQYTQPQSEIFEYKMEGYNDNWQKIIGGNNLSFPNFPSGTFKLLIRVSGDEAHIKTLIIEKPTSYLYVLWVFLSVVSVVVALFVYSRLIKDRLELKLTQAEALKQKKRYQNVKLDTNELEDIKSSLIKYIETDHPYLNTKLKLDDVSREIKYPKAKISQVLNQHLSTNFTDFINSYRVEEFKRKSHNGLTHQYSLDGFYKECGFSSRSSFFHSFKKITGQTPLEYLKETGIIIEK